MESLVSAVGALIVRALPTFILVFLLYLYLRRVLFTPLSDTLDKRRNATTGTRKQAEESLKRAEAKAAEYEEKLRAARSAIYKEQEELRRVWREEHARSLAQARERIEAQLKAARGDIESGKQAALEGLRAQSDALAEQIARAVLTGRAA